MARGSRLLGALTSPYPRRAILMPIVPPPPPTTLPTNVAPLPRLLAYAQTLGLERHPHRPKRGLPTLGRQQRRWLRDGGAIRLGACPWADRLRLFALSARTPTDQRGPGSTSPACSRPGRSGSPPSIAAAGAPSKRSRSCTTATI